jgi:hypothetical protein
LSEQQEFADYSCFVAYDSAISFVMQRSFVPREQSVVLFSSFAKFVVLTMCCSCSRARKRPEWEPSLAALVGSCSMQGQVRHALVSPST